MPKPRKRRRPGHVEYMTPLLRYVRLTYRLRFKRGNAARLCGATHALLEKRRLRRGAGQRRCHVVTAIDVLAERNVPIRPDERSEIGNVNGHGRCERHAQ